MNKILLITGSAVSIISIILLLLHWAPASIFLLIGLCVVAVGLIKNKYILAAVIALLILIYISINIFTFIV
ncbi:MAG: hypothetical protein Q4F97_05815 [Bacteroidales bacterium]|nr:hypothetical protein [Bacteroidales bacterium]